jgi:hypothetical protein
MTYVSIAKSIETRRSSSYSAARARKVPGKVVDYCASAAATIRSTGNRIFFPVSGGVLWPFTFAPAIWGPVGTSDFYRWEPGARLKEERNATLPLGFMSFLRSLLPGRREFPQMLSAVDAQRLYLQIPWIGRGAIKRSRASDLRGLFPHCPGLSVNCIRPTPGFREARRTQKSTELQVCHGVCSPECGMGLPCKRSELKDCVWPESNTIQVSEWLLRPSIERLTRVVGTGPAKDTGTRLNRHRRLSTNQSLILFPGYGLQQNYVVTGPVDGPSTELGASENPAAEQSRTKKRVSTAFSTVSPACLNHPLAQKRTHKGYRYNVLVSDPHRMVAATLWNLSYARRDHWQWSRAVPCGCGSAVGSGCYTASEHTEWRFVLAPSRDMCGVRAGVIWCNAGRQSRDWRVKNHIKLQTRG